MKRRTIPFGFFIIFMALASFVGCGGGDKANDIASIEIVAANDDPIFPRNTKEFTAIARDSAGNVINDVDFVWSSSNDRFAEALPEASPLKFQTTEPTATFLFKYPTTSLSSSLLIQARIGTVSGTFNALVVPPINNGDVTALTDNALEDNWGLNNNWSTTSRDRVLWTQFDGIDSDLILGDTDGNTIPLRTGISDIDFLALGSADETSDNIMSSWREDLSNTYVDDGSNTPDNLGALFQEENSVSFGCLFFREGLPSNDIMRFTFAEGLDEIFTTGNSLGPVIGSNCQVVWAQENGALMDIMIYDGNTAMPLVSSLPLFTWFDFHWGMLVYSADNDIFLVDTTAGDPQPVNITNTPGDIENFARTDGNSVLISRIANGITNQIVLYDIETGDEAVISTTTASKEGASLFIDLKQAVWKEGGNLFFHDGSGTTAGTSMIPIPGSAPLNVMFQGYVIDGTVTWIGDDGDDEVYIMK